MGKQRQNPSPERKPFGRFIKRLRDARGMTQEVLAERSGLSADSIRRLEHATFSPSLETLTKLANGLRLDLSSLFIAFELRELSTDRELLAIVRGMTPAEQRISLRMLSALVEILATASDDDDGEDYRRDHEPPAGFEVMTSRKLDPMFGERGRWAYRGRVNGRAVTSTGHASRSEACRAAWETFDRG